MTTNGQNRQLADATVAIIGLGLMGGSLAMALRRHGASPTIHGCALCHLARQKALEAGIVDAAFDSAPDAVAGADIVVFCVPVLQTREVAAQCQHALKPGSVITDVGSTKGQVMAEMMRIASDKATCFVGSHPMVGSEAAGFNAARPDLFDRGVVIVTPTAEQAAGEAPSTAVDIVRNLWRAVGADVILMGAQQHDALVARTSHLPHLAAAVLVDSVFRDPIKGLEAFCGRGFRDTTRVAGGSEDVWHDIVATNRPAIIEELGQYGARVAQLKSLLEKNDLEAVRCWLRLNRERREQLV